MHVLFLFESTLPQAYHSQTLSPGELRVIASISSVSRITAIGRSGEPFYAITGNHEPEPKVNLHRVPFTGHTLGYYAAPLWLFFAGLWNCSINKTNLIHAESPHLSGIAAVLLGKIFKIPVIVELRVSYEQVLDRRLPVLPHAIKHRLFSIVTTWVFKHADYILGNSSFYQQQLQAAGYPHVSWYNPGVRLLSSPPKRRTSPKVTLGFLGRLYPDKGPLYALQAYDYLITKYPQYKQTTQLLFAGQGPETEVLQKYIHQHALQRHVKLLGTQDRWQFLSRIDILLNPCIVLPALEMSIAEAAAVGIPAICFGNDDIPVTVIDNQTGYRVPNFDIQSMAEHTHRLLRKSTLRHRMGDRAKKFALHTFSFTSQVARLQKVYRKLHVIT